jgi:hypothetical protein
LARLALSLLGLPNGPLKFVSLTVLLVFGVIYYSMRVHTSGFGNYNQLLPVVALPAILANLILISGIVLAIATSEDNIFSAPQYSGGGDGKTWGHQAADRRPAGNRHSWSVNRLFVESQILLGNL